MISRRNKLSGQVRAEQSEFRSGLAHVKSALLAACGQTQSGTAARVPLQTMRNSTNADLNAACNILRAGGHPVSARGGLAAGQPAKRETLSRL